MTTVTGADMRGSFSPASSFSQAWLECAHLIWLHLDGLCPSALGQSRVQKCIGITPTITSRIARGSAIGVPSVATGVLFGPQGSRTTTITIRSREKASLGHGSEGWRGRDD
jgi:hypothetical protein